eukprot:1921371-Alexandrium_andersonii.AAC.1
MGTALCRCLGLGGVAAGAVEGRDLADATQFRSLVQRSDSEEACLCKGVVLPWSGLGMEWLIYESCVKVRGPAGPLPPDAFGVD